MRTLSRKKSHRESMLRNLATSLFLYESIETTEAKAKEVQALCDKIITRAKDADLNSIKYLNSVLLDNNAVKKVVKEIVPRFASRKSGFSRIYKTGYRVGDNAATARIELLEKKMFVEEKKTVSESKTNEAKDKPKADKKSDKDVTIKVKKEAK